MTTADTDSLDTCPSCGLAELYVISAHSDYWIIECRACHYSENRRDLRAVVSGEGE